MPFDYFGDQCYALLGWHVRQPNESGVCDIVQVDQLPKVGVYCNQDPVRRFCQFQQGLVARVRAQGPSLDHVICVVAEPLRQTASRASIYEKPHDPATET